MPVERQQQQYHPSDFEGDDLENDFDSGERKTSKSAPMSIIEYVQGNSETSVEEHFDDESMSTTAHMIASVTEELAKDGYDAGVVTLNAAKKAVSGTLSLLRGAVGAAVPILATEDANLRSVRSGRRHNTARIVSQRPPLSEEERMASGLEVRFALSDVDVIDSPVITGAVKAPRSSARAFYGCFPTITNEELNRVRGGMYKHGAKFNYFTTPHEVKQFSIRYNFAIVDLDDNTIYYNGDTFNPKRAKWILFERGRVCYTNSINTRALKKASLLNWNKYIGADFDNWRESKDPDAVSEEAARALLCCKNGTVKMRRSHDSTSVMRGVLDTVSSGLDNGLSKIADAATEAVLTSNKMLDAVHQRGNSILPTSVLHITARVNNTKVNFRPTTELSQSELLDMSQAELKYAAMEGDEAIRARVTSSMVMPRNSRIRGEVYSCTGPRAVYDAFPTVPDLAHHSNIFKYPVLKIFVSPREVHAMSCLVNMTLFDLDVGTMYVNTLTTKLNDFPRTIIHSRGYVWYCDHVSMSGMIVADIRDFNKPLGPQKPGSKL